MGILIVDLLYPTYKFGERDVNICKKLMSKEIFILWHIYEKKSWLLTLVIYNHVYITLSMTMSELSYSKASYHHCKLNKETTTCKSYKGKKWLFSFSYNLKEM